MTIYTDVEISQEVEVNLDIDEIYKNLSKYEKEELFELLLSEKYRYNKDYYLETLFSGKTDAQILSNKKTIDNLIRIIKYNHVDQSLVQYIIEELSY